MADTEIEKITNNLLRAAWLLVIVHALVMGLIMTFAVIVICLIAASVARPAENNNVQIQSSPRTFDDNVHDVLKAQGKVQ